jgi:hypothetical protein
MNKRDLGCQREDRILVEEEEILHEIENQQRTNTPSLANYFFSQFASLKRCSGNSSKQSIVNRVLLSWARRAEACIANDGKHFGQLL